MCIRDSPDVDAAQREVVADPVQGEAPDGDGGAQGEVERAGPQRGGEVGVVGPLHAASSGGGRGGPGRS